MISWNEKTSDVHLRNARHFLSRIGSIDCLELLVKLRESSVVLVDKKCWEGIKKHLLQRNTELGGLLIGNVYSSEGLEIFGTDIITIHDYIQSSSYESTSVSLRMNPEVWSLANRFVGSQNLIVGWYHSHPNIGAFFSGVDRKTQRDFFHHSYSLGLVVDPFGDEHKFFIGRDSLEIPSSNVIIIDASIIKD